MFTEASLAFVSDSWALLCDQVYQACVSVTDKGLFYPPTLITGVQTVSAVVTEEASNICNIHI